MNLAITRLIENDSPRNLLVFVCLLICGTAFGAEKISDALFVVNKNDHCGYINSSGRLAIQMVFEDCRDFSEGLAPVQINKRWGFINQGGKLEIQPQFDECRWSFSEGLAAVRLGKNWGYIDPKGNFVIPPQFAYAQGFSEGRAVVLVGQKHGITDKTALLTDLFDDSGWSFSTGLLAVERDSQWGFVNLRGDVVIPLQFHRVKEFAEGLAAVGAYRFSDGLGLVIKNDKYGFIGSSGQFVVRPKYDLCFPFRAELAAVSYGKWQQKGIDFGPPE